ncbi:hypothetical protein JNUCC77_19200 (plasmid) [Enterococcus alishanensis]
MKTIRFILKQLVQIIKIIKEGFTNPNKEKYVFFDEKAKDNLDRKLDEFR